MLTSKSRIQNVILINWKGIFFHPFNVDYGLTTLEGGNGTGKTTVMIAAYICLMPDLKYLNFQNVTGLSGRRNEDKGLYGRLGQGDLVYTLLDIATADGKRHLLGVKLVKGTYPKVSLDRFAVESLDADADLEDVLLKTIPGTSRQEIVDIPEIGKRASEHGGQLINFRYVKDYFRFMFDNGITPLRLTENDERKQYNQLLSTSLYGGLSRSLQSSLRDYLMPEDNTLISSLQDMENNLLSCRRTRSAINRYHSIREALQNVYQTGLEMFSNAFFAARLEGEQVVKKALFLRNERRDMERRRRKLSDEAAMAEKDAEIKEEEHKQATHQWVESREYRDKCQNARNIKLQKTLKTKEQEKQLALEDQAREKLSIIKKKTEETRSETQELTRQQMELAEQLSDAGQAWETLSKEAGLFQQAERLLKQAQSLWSEDIDPDNALKWLDKAETAFRQSQEEHNEIYRQWKEVNLKYEHFQVYHQLLEELAGRTIPYEEAAAEADREISNFYEHEERLKKEDGLSTEIGELESLIDKRTQVEKQLKEAGFGNIESSRQLEDAWRDSIAENQKLEAARNLVRDEISQKEQEIKLIESKLPDLKKKLEQWEQFQDWKKQLEDSVAETIGTSDELTGLRKSLDVEHEKLTMSKFRLEIKLEEYKKLFAKFSRPDNSEDSDSGANRLAELGYGSLLASRYEDIPLEWSANLQSRLGPLSQALVVEDVEDTARKLADNPDRPEILWMVEKGNSEKLPKSLEISDSFLVRHGNAWRLQRLPEFPSLGKKARRQKIDSLREKIQRTSREIEKNFQSVQQIEKNKTLLNKLIPLADILDSPSPAAEIRELENDGQRLRLKIERTNKEKTRISEDLTRLEKRRDQLQKCFVHKDVLDRSRLDEERKSLLEELKEIKELKMRRGREKSQIVRLNRGMEMLKEPPLENRDWLSAEREKKREREETWRARLEIMRKIKSNLKYFRFASQVPLLERRKGLTRHLKERMGDVRLKQEELEKLLKSYSELQTEAERVLYKEEKLSINLDGQLSQLKQNLVEMGMEGDDQELIKSESLVQEKAREKEDKDALLNRVKNAVFRLRAEEKIAGESADKARDRFAKFHPRVGPTLKQWRSIRRQAREDGTLNRLAAEYFSAVRDGDRKPEVFRRRESASRAALIKVTERLTDGGSLLNAIKSIDSRDEKNGDSQTVSIWREVRDYLNQVIPIDMRDDDLEEVQRLIIEKLEGLKENLERQENTLLTYLEAIPNHIMAQIRKQKSRIRRLNQQLEKVKFGFLQTIRINIEMQNQLKAFLVALPEKLDHFTAKTNEKLAAAEVIASLYEEMGAGKVKGDLLLDYRHYLLLNIEVKREGGSRFEKVTSANLSTGESIGVGMAVLIMMLMSWEEQSCLLRGVEEPTGLRFLLLDESSRLDQKALHTLSDFCRHLRLQLLIAAPSVEKTLEGTTHHLTRGHFGGQEEVIVRGRRFTANQEKTEVSEADV